MLGTIADLMPLIGENRRIVKEGLRELYTDPIRAFFIDSEQLSLDARDVRSDDISFRLAPLLNAPDAWAHRIRPSFFELGRSTGNSRSFPKLLICQ